MGVKKNFGYNLILTLCNYLFPLITFPYVSRVLHADNVGLCGFVDGIINYLVLFSMLGIGSYGVREIARCGNDKERRSEVFSSLLSLNAIFTFVAVAVLVVSTLCIGRLQPYREFLGIGVLKLVFNTFLIEWFFRGIEQFKYITLRTVAVNACYVISVLLLVKDTEDTVTYYLLTTLVVVANALFNILFSRRHCRFSIKKSRPRRHLASVFSFGYYTILTSMYTTFNVVFLGFVSTELQTGYFVTSTKLYTIIMAAFGAFTVVMVPRISAMLASGEKSKLQGVADDTFDLLLLVSVPMIIFGFLFAPEIINLVAGAGYEGAVLPFRIIVFLLLVVGMEQIVIQQFLMATTSNRSIMIVSTVGAAVGITLNLFVTPAYGATGSATAWAISEVCVLVTGYFLMKKNIDVTLNSGRVYKALLSCAPYVVLNLLLFLLPGTVGFWVAIVLNPLLFILLNLKVNKDSVIAKHMLPVVGNLFKK